MLSTKIFIRFTVILNLGHILEQLNMIQLSNSNWLPHKLTSCVETFIAAINHDIKYLKTKKLPHDNLTKFERETLLNLQKINGTVITKSDKGGAVVILDIKDYNDEANRQLHDTNNYEHLDFDPTELHTEKIKSELSNRKDVSLLISKTANSLLEEKIQTHEFFTFFQKYIKLTIQEDL